MRYLRDALITLAILIVIGAAVAFLSLPNLFAATAAPGRFESSMALRLRNRSIPAGAKAMQNPLAGRTDAWRDALNHFGDHCAVCHGNDGKGGSEIGRRMSPRVPDMTRPRTQNLTDGEIFYIISNGVRWTGMPAWKDEHSAEETWQLVSLIRRLPRLTPNDVQQIEKTAPHEHEHEGHE